MVVKTRFAPSPTGFLHVGGVRTALFSWLYAKRHAGEFILRIEDTDEQRSLDDSVQAILAGMEWLGLCYDQGPFFQSERHDRYQYVANKLLAEGKAYRCTCSKDRLETLRAAQLNAKEKPRYDGRCRHLNLSASNDEFVIRFKNPEMGSVSFNDQVYGDIVVENAELDDLIMVRSDGHPTYNFAVVIDDLDMEITHVIRGDDHINNTPRQINLFNALEAPVPVFAHLPMILGEDGKRLSKRHGAVSVLQFREQGILPHALLNYLVRLGWSHGDQELFSLEDMTKFFDLHHVSRGVSGFNYEKLYWINQHYLKTDSPLAVADALAWQFEQQNIDVGKGPKLADVVSIQADRCKNLKEMVEKSVYFYRDEIEYDQEAMKKHLRPVILAPFTRLYDRLEQENNWTIDRLQQIVNQVCSEFDISMGKLGQPVRVAVTGSNMSPAIDVTLALLGKVRSIKRLHHALKYIRNRAINIE